MRAYVKKKNYRAHVRGQTLSGLINTHEGNWAPPGNTSPSIVRNVLEGTRGKASRRTKKFIKTSELE